MFEFSLNLSSNAGLLLDRALWTISAPERSLFNPSLVCSNQKTLWYRPTLWVRVDCVPMPFCALVNCGEDLAVLFSWTEFCRIDDWPTFTGLALGLMHDGVLWLLFQVCSVTARWRRPCARHSRPRKLILILCHKRCNSWPARWRRSWRVLLPLSLIYAVRSTSYFPQLMCSGTWTFIDSQLCVWYCKEWLFANYMRKLGKLLICWHQILVQPTATIIPLWRQCGFSLCPSVWIVALYAM